MTEPVELIASDGVTLAWIIRGTFQPEQTRFVTPDDSTLQFGFVVFPAGTQVIPHEHLPLPRSITGTAELLMVRSGRCDVDVYDENEDLVASRELGPGDTILSVAGGHGFRMHEDTVLVELKQGPYVGVSEKRRFTPKASPAK